MSPFQGKTVLITGAGNGFGLATARAFAAQGAQLALSDVDVQGIDIAGALVQQVDVSHEDQISGHVEACLARFGRIDVAVNNAGIGGAMAPIWETDVADFDRVMAVNARGVFLGMKHQIPPMIVAGGGAIVNISSASGLVGAAAMSAYAASKHAVVGLTRSAADEVARFKLRVNAICPSFTDTDLFNELADALGAKHGLDRADAYKRITSRIPMRRVAHVDEVVQAVLWAADPGNSFMTGQAIAIDGGLTAV